MLNNHKDSSEWTEDINISVNQYNEWFIMFAPTVYETKFNVITERVKELVLNSNGFNSIDLDLIRKYPTVIEILRLCTAPPLARDRLTGLSGLSQTASSFVKKLEEGTVQSKNSDENIIAILHTINRMLDKNLFPWINDKRIPTPLEVENASKVVADRLIASVANTIIKNAQEQRQLSKVIAYLENKNYKRFLGAKFNEMPLGTYSTRLNVPGKQADGKSINIPIDIVIKSFKQDPLELPILVECKSAGDFTNTNKRRKEEAEKLSNLNRAYGEEVSFILFLCGYFGQPYLSYEAAKRIDWVWEHRIEDLEEIL